MSTSGASRPVGSAYLSSSRCRAPIRARASWVSAMRRRAMAMSQVDTRALAGSKLAREPHAETKVF